MDIPPGKRIRSTIVHDESANNSVNNHFANSQLNNHRYFGEDDQPSNADCVSVVSDTPIIVVDDDNAVVAQEDNVPLRTLRQRADEARQFLAARDANIVPLTDAEKQPLLKYEYDHISDPKLIAMYAEKGGVGKTTTITNLAWSLARLGHRVLLYDLDAQRSLTAWTFHRLVGEPNPNQEIPEYDPTTLQNFNGNPVPGDLTTWVHGNVTDIALPLDTGNLPRTFYDQFKRARQGLYAEPALARWVPNDYGLKLWCVPGSANISDLDETIGFEERLAATDQFTPNRLTGSGYHLILSTARRYNADYVLLDFSPSAGVLNRSLIMSSHYLLIPTVADFFSAEMMRNMAIRLARWNTHITAITNSTEHTWYPFPPHRAKFLGYVLSRYVAHRVGDVADANEGFVVDTLRINERTWSIVIHNGAERLRSRLTDINYPSINLDVYNRLHRSRKLGQFKHFYTLGNLADYHHVPIHFLRENRLVQVRHHANGELNVIEMKTPERYKYLVSIKLWCEIFDLFVTTIRNIIDADRHQGNNNSNT